MLAIIYAGSRVVGYRPDTTDEDMDESGLIYELVEELPEIIANCPQGYVVEKQDGEFVLVEIPVLPVPEPGPTLTEALNRIETLEALLDAILMGGV
jgi:hypothetical protein